MKLLMRCCAAPPPWVQELEKKVQAEVEDCVEFADNSPKPVSLPVIPASCSDNLNCSGARDWVLGFGGPTHWGAPPAAPNALQPPRPCP